MGNTYCGKSSVSAYYRVKIKSLFNALIWSSILEIVLISLFALSICGTINAFNHQFDEFISYDLIIPVILVLDFILILLIAGILALIISEAIRIKKTNIALNASLNLVLTNVSKVLIDYDSKEWLTAPKNTYHPLSAHLDVNGSRLNLKTKAIFTNSSKYSLFPSYRMPEILMNKNYINNYALVGYDEENNELVIIKIIKE